jgi:hypothetical protein
MQGKSHLYFLVDEMNRSLYADGDLVKVSAIPKPLVFTPDGWTKIEINNQRNTKYFALDRSFSIPLDFVEDGALILKDAYYKKGVEAKVYLVILKQKINITRDVSGNITGFGYYYDSFYRGEIDFSQFQHKGPKVTVNIMEGGIPKYIKAGENTKYELDVDVPEARYVLMDGVNLKIHSQFLISNGADPDELRNHFIALDPITVDGSSKISIKAVERSKFTGNNNDLVGNPNWFFSATTSTTVNLSYKFKVGATIVTGASIDPGGRTSIQFQVVRGNTVTSYAVFFGLLPGGGQVLQGQVSINVQAGDHIYFRTFFTTIGSTGDAVIRYHYFDIPDSYLFVDAAFRWPASFIKVLPPEYVFKKLIEKVTNGSYQAESIILSNNHNISMTCGDAIRGIPGSKIKTSLSDFFTSYDVQFDLGLGDISGKVKLESKTAWIDYNNPINLGEVKELKVKPAADYLYNTIKCGYPEQQYDDVNGKQEFNNTSLFTTPITRVSKELNKVSAYRADCYGIEFTRMNLENKTTTDNSSDNDVFLIHTATAPIPTPIPVPTYGGFITEFFILERSLNATVSGVLDPAGVFNLFLSPKRCLERNGRFIHSLFYKLDGEKLVFQTTEKNAELKTTSPLVIEKADVQIGSLLPQLFSPNLLEFETPAPVDLIEALEASPIRTFTGSYLGVPFDGIPVKVSAASETNEAQDYTLLASPSTNLEPLIKIFE